MKMLDTDKIDRLRALGYTVGARDERVNTLYPGRYMVIESHDESELPTRDGSNGPWAIVGDDLNELINDALENGPHIHEDT